MHMLKCFIVHSKCFPAHFIKLLFESEATIIKKEVNCLNAFAPKANRLPMGRILGLLMIK